MTNGTVSLWIFVLLVLLAVPLVANAQTVSVPHTFTNGSVADADDVNENFDTLENEIELVKSELALLRASHTVSNFGSGACIIRNSSSSLNGALDPGIGDGFAKIAVTGVEEIAMLQAACTDTLFDELLTEYCKYNTDSVQRQVVAYDAATGNVQSSACAAQGCSLISCP